MEPADPPAPKRNDVIDFVCNAGIRCSAGGLSVDRLNSFQIHP